MVGKHPKRTPRTGVDRAGRTRLHYAAAEGAVAEVIRLVEASANPSAQLRDPLPSECRPPHDAPPARPLACLSLGFAGDREIRLAMTSAPRARCYPLTHWDEHVHT